MCNQGPGREITPTLLEAGGFVREELSLPKGYLDPIQFVSVSAINASFSVSAGANVGGTFGATDAGTVGANVGFMAVNSVPDQDGPDGETFRRRIKALAELVRLGCRLSQRRIIYPRHQPFAADEVNGRAYVEAAMNGLYFIDAGDGKLNLGSKHILPGLFVPNPKDPKVIEQLRILDAGPGYEFYTLRPATQLQVPNSMWSDRSDGRLKESIYVIPRSVISLMGVASKSVEPPTSHKESGIAPPLEAVPVNSSLKLFMRIRSSPTEPNDEYRIFHRGYWFYIDDRDYTSKRQFSQLVCTYSHSLGDKAPPVPTLTLPMGGR